MVVVVVVVVVLVVVVVVVVVAVVRTSQSARLPVQACTNVEQVTAGDEETVDCVSRRANSARNVQFSCTPQAQTPNTW